MILDVETGFMDAIQKRWVAQGGTLRLVIDGSQQVHHQTGYQLLITDLFFVRDPDDLFIQSDEGAAESNGENRLFRVEKLMLDQPIDMGSLESNPIFIPAGFPVRVVAMLYVWEQDHHGSGFDGLRLSVPFAQKESGTFGDIDQLVFV